MFQGWGWSRQLFKFVQVCYQINTDSTYLTVWDGARFPLEKNEGWLTQMKYGPNGNRISFSQLRSRGSFGLDYSMCGNSNHKRKRALLLEEAKEVKEKDVDSELKQDWSGSAPLFNTYSTYD